jgi:hypothetical protein
MMNIATYCIEEKQFVGKKMYITSKNCCAKMIRRKSIKFYIEV